MVEWRPPHAAAPIPAGASAQGSAAVTTPATRGGGAPFAEQAEAYASSTAGRRRAAPWLDPIGLVRLELTLSRASFDILWVRVGVRVKGALCA